MQSVTLLILAVVLTVALAEGEFYVPRSYYIIDAEGHESAPVPLRRLRRSVGPYPYAYGGANANANANADANANGWGGGANANANANANARANGGWRLPSGGYGAAQPKGLSVGMTRRQFGPIVGRSVSASTSVGVDSSGQGFYDESASVSN